MENQKKRVLLDRVTIRVNNNQLDQKQVQCKSFMFSDP